MAIRVAIDLKVAELLCSRLCHELVNPVGAVNNGVELLTELAAADPETLSLIFGSARSAASRLQFYRLAYGQAAGVSADLTLAEALSLARGVVETSRLRLVEPAEVDAVVRLGRPATKLLLNLLVLASEALPRGGAVSVTFIASSGRRTLVVSAEGDQPGLGPETLAAAQNALPDDELSARTVHAYFTARLSSALDLPFEIEQSAHAIQFRMGTGL